MCLCPNPNQSAWTAHELRGASSSSIKSLVARRVTTTSLGVVLSVFAMRLHERRHFCPARAGSPLSGLGPLRFVCLFVCARFPKLYTIIMASGTLHFTHAHLYGNYISACIVVWGKINARASIFWMLQLYMLTCLCYYVFDLATCDARVSEST